MSKRSFFCQDFICMKVIKNGYVNGFTSSASPSTSALPLRVCTYVPEGLPVSELCALGLIVSRECV